MRKEKLMEKKEAAVKNLTWYLKQTMTEEDLKAFSVSQLERICKMMEAAEAAEAFREECEPWYGLSATEVINKKNGKIAYFEENGNIREESREECRTGAACSTLAEYERKFEKK